MELNFVDYTYTIKKNHVTPTCPEFQGCILPSFKFFGYDGAYSEL